MKKFFVTLIFISGIIKAQALIISEIMSNPIGDDSGREWIEVYNNSQDSIDLSSLSISIKGGTFVPITPVQGGTTLSPNSYAVIGSTVANATKFLQDYSSYSSLLFRSSISLVNTGVTSIALKLNGITVDTLPSYTAAKEGYTLSLISNNFVLSNPTPGTENQIITQEVTGGSQGATTTDGQAVVAQMSPPSADIVLYLAPEKILVAGAPSNFQAFGMTRKGDMIPNLTYTWAYGDGGHGVGSSTIYRYLYPGTYIAQVEATNGYVLGVGRIGVRVVSPDIAITKISSGKYGSYIDIFNPNTYDLELSGWKLSIDGAMFSFPKNTMDKERVNLAE